MGIIKIGLIVVIIGVAIHYLLKSMLEDFPVAQKIDGYVKPGFEEVETVFRKNFEDGYEEHGAAFAVCHRGELVVDLWGGFADKMALREWKKDTITMAYSSTKAIAGLIIAMLVDRGLLKYDELVIKYWPEFGAHGKDNVTVKMLVSHEAGLVALDQPITIESVGDWRQMSKLFEDQIPNWPPGTLSGYHLLTFGWLCDQLVHRVDPQKRSLGQFFNEEIAKPFGIDFYIGLPRDQLYRMARMSLPTLWDYLKRIDDWQFVQFVVYSLFTSWSVMNRAMTNPDWLISSQGTFQLNNYDLQELEVAAVNGIGTARGLAQLFCLLDGSKLLSKPIINMISQPVLNVESAWMNITFSWGFMHSKNPEGSYVLGHPGYGGQNAKYDPMERVSFAYLRNHLAPDTVDPRTYRKLEQTTYQIINKMKKG